MVRSSQIFMVKYEKFNVVGIVGEGYSGTGESTKNRENAEERLHRVGNLGDKC